MRKNPRAQRMPVRILRLLSSLLFRKLPRIPRNFFRLKIVITKGLCCVDLINLLPKRLGALSLLTVGNKEAAYLDACMTLNLNLNLVYSLLLILLPTRAQTATRKKEIPGGAWRAGHSAKFSGICIVRHIRIRIHLVGQKMALVVGVLEERMSCGVATCRQQWEPRVLEKKLEITAAEYPEIGETTTTTTTKRGQLVFKSAEFNKCRILK